MTPAAARERLSALGFRDPVGALRHIESLTEGLTRRAAIQRHLLPVMLGWFAAEADPEASFVYAQMEALCPEPDLFACVTSPRRPSS